MTNTSASSTDHVCVADSALSRIAGLVKVGLKGPGLRDVAAALTLELPDINSFVRIDRWGVLARVAKNEIIIECEPTHALIANVQRFLTERSSVYEIEQQSETFELHGRQALRVFAETCGVDVAREPTGRIIFTRVAGVSCGLIPLEQDGSRVYRIWADCTFAPYLWEQLSNILLYPNGGS
jgi:sarcosine oxidase gamma subunit